MGHPQDQSHRPTAPLTQSLPFPLPQFRKQRKLKPFIFLFVIPTPHACLPRAGPDPSGGLNASPLAKAGRCWVGRLTLPSSHRAPCSHHHRLGGILSPRRSYFCHHMVVPPCMQFSGSLVHFGVGVLQVSRVGLCGSTATAGPTLGPPWTMASVVRQGSDQ